MQSREENSGLMGLVTGLGDMLLGGNDNKPQHGPGRGVAGRGRGRGAPPGVHPQAGIPAEGLEGYGVGSFAGDNLTGSIQDNEEHPAGPHSMHAAGAGAAAGRGGRGAGRGAADAGRGVGAGRGAHGPHAGAAGAAVGAGSPQGVPPHADLPLYQPQDENAPRVVGIMYSVWHDQFLKGPHIKPDGTCHFHERPYGANVGCAHWWGIPEYVAKAAEREGADPRAAIKQFYKFGGPGAPNAALIDHHAKLLLDAGVDFIFVDLTNGEQEGILKGAHALCKRYSQLVGQGRQVPLVVLWVKGVEVIDMYWQQYYSKYDPRIFFRLDGKPLLLVRPFPSPGLLPQDDERFTLRECWGLLNEGRDAPMWSFKQNQLPYSPYVHNGAVEQMPVSFAAQRQRIKDDTDPGKEQGRQGRRDGAFFHSCLDLVLQARPRIMTVCSWNEWTSQNQSGCADKACFTDIFGPEFSSDCEPSVEHGRRYYAMLKQAVQKFKSS